MSTEKQIRATRENALRAKGPTTMEGKAVAAKNALKHGLFSRQVLLPSENAEAFREFAENIKSELNPQGGLEDALVERIVGLLWRLQRLEKIEAGILSLQTGRARVFRGREKSIQQMDAKAKSALDLGYSRDPNYQKLRQQGQEAESEIDSETAVAGLGFVHDSRKDNALTKLSRYETSMQNNLHRALHELQRLQAARKGKEVPVPIALDVAISETPKGIITLDSQAA